MRIRPRSRLQMNKGNDLSRWTVSFADFMTLMFAVFVVLYAVAAKDDDQYKELLQGVKNGSKLLNQQLLSSNYDGILTHNSNNIIDDSGPALLSDNNQIQQPHENESALNIPKSGGELNALKIQLEESFESATVDEVVKLDLNGDWLTIEMNEQLLFVKGSHTLLSSAQNQIKKLALVLKPVNNSLRIRGYTDQTTISDEIYKSNWELSGARAFSVLHALKNQGVIAQRMVVEAYGEYQPVIDKIGNIDKAKSRRVVIAISKYAFNSDHKNSMLLSKPDSEKMHTLHPSKNRVIITTRQE